jgi:hypothetical protein
MFRLIKWSAYAFFGYAVYEFWCGLTSEVTACAGRESARHQRVQRGNGRQPQISEATG